ncbi:hypothetical protein [Nocardioides bigeumensis]|uniref:DUF4244 domain-containing protein n=1 Tax=Nocardioides bigeumensis TaxID=433657 RepID=A0ABN2XZ58_9ACTN
MTRKSRRAALLRRLVERRRAQRRHDEPRHDEPRHDEPRHDEPRHDEPRHDERRLDERGDVPGWVMITVMTVAIVGAIWAVADDQLTAMLTTALNSVSKG